MVPVRVIERVLTRWVPQGDCWVSTYSVGSHGYAQVGWNEAGKKIVTVAHRVAWVGANGPIPPDMTVDHRCHVKRCVNPVHLRLLDNPTNASDNGQVRTNSDAGRVCRNGHPLSVSMPSGHTYCRTCQAALKRERRR